MQSFMYMYYQSKLAMVRQFLMHASIIRYKENIFVHICLFGKLLSCSFLAAIVFLINALDVAIDTK